MQLCGLPWQGRPQTLYYQGLSLWVQIQQSLGNPFVNGAMPRLKYVLHGIKRVETLSGSGSRVRLPITITIMTKLREVWLSPPLQPDNIML